jgi:transcriptional regulator with XRE-family HTH domain
MKHVAHDRLMVKPGNAVLSFDGAPRFSRQLSAKILVGGHASGGLGNPKQVGALSSRLPLPDVRQRLILGPVAYSGLPYPKEPGKVLVHREAKGFADSAFREKCVHASESIAMNYTQSIALNPFPNSVLGMNTMAERLQEALDRRGLTPPDLIRGAKLAKGTIYNILNGTTSPEKIWGATAKTICSYLGISSDWFLAGRGEMNQAMPAIDDDMQAVQAYAHGIALGDGSMPGEYAEANRLLFRKSSLRNKGLLGRELEVYYGRGDSMEPRIRDGDAILVDRGDTDPKDGHVFVLEGPHGALAKRLTNIDGRWFFESDNKADPKWRKPVPLDGKDTYSIAGKVRWIGSWEG